MADKLCGCTVPRSMTPTEPFIKRTFRPGSRHITPIPEDETNSRYASARTEELPEIRNLFDRSYEHEPLPSGQEDKSADASTVSSKHSKIASFFRRRLSRTFSKSKLDKPDPEKLKEAKNQICSNLLNDGAPDEGGYDADAPVLKDVDELPNPYKDIANEPARGRTKTRRHSIPFSTWSGGDGPSRLSIDLSPPRLSFGNHSYHRRSHSMYSLAAAGDDETFHMRLPSFAGNRDTSQSWKKGVLESLQINSPSLSALVHTPIRRSPVRATREKSERSLVQWPLREPVLTPDSDAPLMSAPQSPPLAISASETGSLLFGSARPSEDTGYMMRVAGPSLDHSLSSSHFCNHSSSGGRPHFFMRPERRPPRASNASVHLHTMGISKHLRSVSMTSSVAVQSRAPTIPPTAAPTRAHTPAASTRNPSRTYLIVEDLPPLPPSATKTRASSEYSMDEVSRASTPHSEASQTVVQSPSAQQLSMVSKTLNNASISRTCSSSLIPKADLPEHNPSISNLSDTSKNSSKMSRFKEEFDTPEKKSKKRMSIPNLFNQLAANAKQSRRRRTESIDSLDGVLDEPRRLERAFALTEQKDAAGLLAKAIRDKQAEKATLYLKGNKEAAGREMFRQRSSSFCRPPDDSVSGLSGASEQRTDWHRRSTSEALIKPDTSLPTLQPPRSAGALPRSHSDSNLAPEFSTSMFSGSPFLSPEGGRPPPPSRKQSVALGPLMQSPPDVPGSRLKTKRSGTDKAAALLGVTKGITALERDKEKDKQRNVSMSFARPSTADTDDSVDMGPWSRYPSHTREQRTGSAGARDNVKTRDFAYDINPSQIAAESSDNEVVDGQGRKRSKKKKKLFGTLPKSRSMMFGGLRNYARAFARSSSVEFLNNGKGHRSSISAGGSLEHPELELLPPVFAPMPTIPDRRHEDEDDPALGPNQDEIELKHLLLRRADHGHSFVEPTHAGPSRPHPLHAHHVPNVDGAPHTAQTTEENRRVASSPALVGAISAPDGTVVKNALTYARHYESCIYLPPTTSHSTTSRTNFSLLHETSYSRIANHSAPHSPAESNLIDKMLASNPASANVSPLPSPLVSPVLVPVPMASINQVANPKNRAGPKPVSHKHTNSNTSAHSLRASSMDLLKTLKEAEERERARALEDLLSRARNSLSEERRKMSLDLNVGKEGRKTMADEFIAEGMLGEPHRTWPGARGATSVKASAS